MPMLPEKQPYEEYYVTVGINDLGSEDIDTYTVSVTDGDGVDVTSTLIDAAETTKDGTDLNVWVRGGESGKYYEFVFKVTGVSGSKFEKEASMKVFDTRA